MSQPCTTCGPMGKQQEDEQLKTTDIKARLHAQEKQSSVAVYKDPEGQWRFADPFYVYGNGLAGPGTYVVSFHSDATAK